MFLACACMRSRAACTSAIAPPLAAPDVGCTCAQRARQPPHCAHRLRALALHGPHALCIHAFPRRPTHTHRRGTRPSHTDPHMPPPCSPPCPPPPLRSSQTWLPVAGLTAGFGWAALVNYQLARPWYRKPWLHVGGMAAGYLAFQVCMLAPQGSRLQKAALCESPSLLSSASTHHKSTSPSKVSPQPPLWPPL